MCHHSAYDGREESSESVSDREEAGRGERDERDGREERDRDERRERSPVGEVVRTPLEAVRRAVAAVTP